MSHIASEVNKGNRAMRYAAATNLENAAKFLREDRVEPAVFLCVEISNGFLKTPIETNPEKK